MLKSEKACSTYFFLAEFGLKMRKIKCIADFVIKIKIRHFINANGQK